MVPLATHWRPDLVVHEPSEFAGALAAACTARGTRCTVWARGPRDLGKHEHRRQRGGPPGHDQHGRRPAGSLLPWRPPVVGGRGAAVTDL
ncbi:hypothetical protein [Actinophytocola sp.]|uniref:hypothetical protein n=1 Tax=Actinophytocola sp. TaxID=1872138 RepID=UPI00345C58AE